MAKMTTTARCPMCEGDIEVDPNPHRPFCSERCRLIDLSRWLRGEYAIPGEPANGGALGEDDASDGAENEGSW